MKSTLVFVTLFVVNVISQFPPGLFFPAYESACCLPVSHCGILEVGKCVKYGGRPVGNISTKNALCIDFDVISSFPASINEESFTPCPSEIRSLCPGACCYPDRCEWVFENECCGVFRGNGTTCEYDCAGACCQSGSCTQQIESNCNGTFYGLDTHCEAEGECPSSNWLLGVILLFAALFFLGTVVLLIFILWRNLRN